MRFIVNEEDDISAAKDFIDFMMKANGYAKEATGKVLYSTTSSDSADYRSGCVVNVKPECVKEELDARAAAKEIAKANKK